MWEKIFTPWRLRAYPRLTLGAFFLAVVLVLSLGQGAESLTGRLGGDFVEFYGAGRLALTGQFARLYDAKAQSAAQAGFLPGEKAGSFVPFAYPPHMALSLAPLAALPFRGAFALHLTLSCAFLLVAARLLRPELPEAARDVAVPFAAAVFFYPLTRAILGGQNAALTLLLAVAAHVLVRRGKGAAAGVCLGLLLYKPQFALTFLGLYALAGQWSVLAGGAAAGLGLYVLNAFLCGPDWPGRWMDYADWVIWTSLGFEADKAASLLGFFRGLSLKSSPGLAATGWVLAGLAGLVLALAAWRIGRRAAGRAEGPTLADDGPGGAAFSGLAASGALLIAPHAYYYDAGLLFLAFPALLDGKTPRGRETAAAIWLAGFAQPLAEYFVVSPMLLAVLAVFCLTLWRCWRPQGATPAQAG